MRIGARVGLLSLAWMAVLGASRLVQAQTPDCNTLPADKKAQVREIFSALHPYDGCDQTFARCLAAKPPKPVVLRLASDICRHVRAGDDRKQVQSDLAKRAQTMLGTGPRAKFALDEATRLRPYGSTAEIPVFRPPAR